MILTTGGSDCFWSDEICDRLSGFNAWFFNPKLLSSSYLHVESAISNEYSVKARISQYTLVLKVVSAHRLVRFLNRMKENKGNYCWHQWTWFEFTGPKKTCVVEIHDHMDFEGCLHTCQHSHYICQDSGADVKIVVWIHHYCKACSSIYHLQHSHLSHVPRRVPSLF